MSTSHMLQCFALVIIIMINHDHSTSSPAPLTCSFNSLRGFEDFLEACQRDIGASPQAGEPVHSSHGLMLSPRSLGEASSRQRPAPPPVPCHVYMSVLGSDVHRIGTLRMDVWFALGRLFLRLLFPGRPGSVARRVRPFHRRGGPDHRVLKT